MHKIPTIPKVEHHLSGGATHQYFIPHPADGEKILMEDAIAAGVKEYGYAYIHAQAQEYVIGGREGWLVSVVHY